MMNHDALRGFVVAMKILLAKNLLQCKHLKVRNVSRSNWVVIFTGQS